MTAFAERSCSARAQLIFLSALSGTAAHAEDDRTNALRHEVIVDAPVAEVWAAVTTREGIESWMVAHGEVDLRIGGKMRTHYDPQGVLGDPNTIENTILSFEPMRMLSIKATKPPENFPFKASIEKMWTVIYFEQLEPRRTRITCVGMGYGDDEDSKTLRKHFEIGNAWTMKKLSDRFKEKPSPTEIEKAGTSAPAVMPRPVDAGPQVRVSAKRIDKEAVVAAPLAQVWDAWTTVNGVQTFFASDANVELRVGGAYELFFEKEAPTGSRGSEGCTVLSWLPMEMLSFSWNAPPQWPEIRLERTTVVIRFEDLGEVGVRVRLSHCGFGEGADWDAVQRYFESAWDTVLGRLQRRFADDPRS